MRWDELLGGEGRTEHEHDRAAGICAIPRFAPVAGGLVRTCDGCDHEMHGWTIAELLVQGWRFRQTGLIRAGRSRAGTRWAVERYLLLCPECDPG